ncbi:endonuclease V [Escherichia phage A4]|nr:endonuclease V [Escherichia phage A4]
MITHNIDKVMLLYACINMIVVLVKVYGWFHTLDIDTEKEYNPQEASLGLKIIVLISVVSVYMVLLSTMIKFT